MNRARNQLMSEDRRSVLARLGWITRQLRAKGELPNCNQLAKRYECSYKTIDRDIAMLRDRFDYPITYDRQKHRYYVNGPLPEPVL